MTSSLMMRVRDRVFRLSPFHLFAIAGLLGMVAIGGASLLASQRAGESEAIAGVKALTRVVATTVVEPNLSDALVDGDPAALERLDAVVTGRVLDETTVRVKLWDETGRIVYSDEPALIGEIHALEGHKTESLWSGEVVSEVSSLEGPENRFEAAEADELLEVYLPIDGPDGRPLLYESYFSNTAVTDSAGRIRATFVPIVVAALLLMEAMHLGLAWGLSRHMRRAQLEREQLLQRAIDASVVERRRIAADLHDGVVQDLAGTSFSVSAAAESAKRFGPELAADLRTAAVSTRRSLQSLRSLLVDIYPPNLQQHGLEAALVDLLAPASSLGLETDLSVTGDPDSDAEVVTLVYRVLQESIRNVFRHADATSLAVRIDATSDAVVATVADDGRGFSSVEGVESGHLGLRLLSDLTADAGASFGVDSKPRVGTEVRLEVPL